MKNKKKEGLSSFSLSTLIGSLASVNILIVFIYNWYIITTVGPGAETDALFSGMVVPQLVLAVLGGSLAHVLVPLLSNKEGDQFYHDAWNFFQIIGLFFFLIACFLFVTADIWVAWIVPGFDEQTTTLTVQLLRIQLLVMIFGPLTSVLWSVNQARHRFVLIELSTISANIFSVGFLVWGLSRFGIKAAAWALVLRTMLQTVFLAPSLGPYKKPDWRSESVKQVWVKLRPLVIGSSYYKTDQLVDRFLASMAPTGMLSLLYLSQQIYTAGHAVLNKAIATPAVPLLANKAHYSEWREFRRISNTRLVVMTGMTGFGFLIILLIGEPVLSIVFGHKSFGSGDVDNLWLLLIALGGVWIGGTMGQVLSSSFYAQGNTATPTKIGIFGFTLGLAFKIIGFYLGGIMGLAVGTSLYYVINVLLLYLFLEKGIRQKMLATY